MQLGEAYDAYFEPLCVFANRFVQDSEESLDIVQGLFASLCESPATLEQARDAKAFLYQSVRNRALNVIKHRKVMSEHTVKSAADMPEAYDDLERQIEINELRTSVAQAVNQLPEACRKIFMMSRFDGRTNDEIALETGLSKRTVETQISNALKRLRKFAAHIMGCLAAIGFVSSCVLPLMLCACESDADIDVRHPDAVVLNAFVGVDGSCEVEFYRAAPYGSDSGISLSDEEVCVRLDADGRRLYEGVIEVGNKGVRFNVDSITCGVTVTVTATCGDVTASGESVMPPPPLAPVCSRNGNIVTVLVTDDPTEINYYQITTANRSGREVECDYTDPVFAQARIDALTATPSIGLFGDEAFALTKTRRLTYAIKTTDQTVVETTDKKADNFGSLSGAGANGINDTLRLTLYNLTREHYLYALSLVRLQEYVFVPVFAFPGLYSNTSTGQGIVACVNGVCVDF